VGIYAQKKLDKLDKDNKTQDWDEFIKELKTTFSDKSKQQMPNGRLKHSSKAKETRRTS